MRALLMGNKKTINTNVFTIRFTETSDPAQFNPVYLDDAAGLTPGSTAFDDFFGYSAVRLNGSGQETAEITQAQSGGAGKLDITQLGDLTTGDNVMIKFPVMGIKMTKSGSTCTLSMTHELNKSGYQYYAHTKGNVIKNAFYLGAYKSSNSGGVLNSLSGKTPVTSIAFSYSRNYSRANGTGYEQMAAYQRMFIDALYIMKYGNPDSQTIVGKGYVNTNLTTVSNTGGTNNVIESTYGTNMDTEQIKLFGLEDLWGNTYERIDGAYVDTSNKIYFSTNNQNYNNSGSGYNYTGISFVNNSIGKIESIACTNEGMFLPTSLNYNLSNMEYWCDFGDSGFSSHTAMNVGGGIASGLDAGIFCIRRKNGNAPYLTDGSRLMYL